MSWEIETELELDEYVVESRFIEGEHCRREYRLVHKPVGVKLGVRNDQKGARNTDKDNDKLQGGSRRIAAKEQLYSLHTYISKQIDKLPLLENKGENEFDELQRYQKLYAASEEYVRLYNKLASYSWILDQEDVIEWIDSWSVYLEILYEKGNANLRKRFLRNEKYKLQRRIEKREQTRKNNLPISKQHRETLAEPDLGSYTFRDTEVKSPHQQFKILEKTYSKQYPKIRFQYQRAYKTLYLEPKLKNAVNFLFDELNIVKQYFAKPRVRSNLSDKEKQLAKKHFELAETVIRKQQQGLIDFELLEAWLSIYSIWEVNKSRYDKLCDDYRNNGHKYQGEIVNVS